MATKEKLNIFQRMNIIMKECKSIEKSGFNKFGNYKYVRAVDVIGNVQKLLVTHGVNLKIDEIDAEREPYQNTKGVTNFFSKIKCEATFTNTDDPKDIFKTTYFSISSDSGDKDIFKAKTNGLKYLLSQQFMIVTSDFIDTEDDSFDADPIDADFPLSKEDLAFGPNFKIMYGTHRGKKLCEVSLPVLKKYCKDKSEQMKKGTFNGNKQNYINILNACKHYFDNYESYEDQE